MMIKRGREMCKGGQVERERREKRKEEKDTWRKRRESKRVPQGMASEILFCATALSVLVLPLGWTPTNYVLPIPPNPLRLDLSKFKTTGCLCLDTNTTYYLFFLILNFTITTITIPNSISNIMLFFFSFLVIILLSQPLPFVMYVEEKKKKTIHFYYVIT